MGDLARGGVVFGPKRPLKVRVAETNQPECIIPLRHQSIRRLREELRRLAAGDDAQEQDA